MRQGGRLMRLRERGTKKGVMGPFGKVTVSMEGCGM